MAALANITPEYFASLTMAAGEALFAGLRKT
jgi:hypothetical protein